MREVHTPTGPAQVQIDEPEGNIRAVLAIGHGAGGGVDAPDILAVRTAALAAGVRVVRITQPYRVAGRRTPAPAGQLDTAWLAVLENLAAETGTVPLIVGGRSSGARVACRTAAAAGAVGVVALAFPVHPPGRPEKSRLPEIDAVEVPVFVVSGERDPFGVTPEAPGREVLVLPGAVHDLRKGVNTIGAALVGWLARHGWAA
ncbi:alpha/beta hydrolase [Virgisporangium ochraceum]|uniref:Alpha/beta hydrolase n=1 Tax=Virgisporangium ochraceum TaxID=65505 RepID=A0A8J3ZV23_9ACTN|nr:alpha/beta family hydrolase [Virgisporangium ochraceum]GIJ70186.1 alpha/beta hydrolase [Virgisporangium ochraceum]